MASSSSDLYNTEREKELREAALKKRQDRGSQIKFLVPLIYAPALPLIRIAFRHQPVTRDRLFYGVLTGAFAHGAYLISDLFN